MTTTTRDETATGVVIHRFRPASGLSIRTDRWLKDGLTRAMPDLRLPELFRLRPSIFRDVEFLVVGEDVARGQPVAVLGSRWMSTPKGLRFLHINVQFVAPSLRGGQVFVRSWQSHMADVLSSGSFPTVSALKTYNPVAYCAMRAYGCLPGAAMYPDMAGPSASAEIAATASDIASTLAPRHAFDARTGVLRAVGVPRDLYRDRPRSDDDRVNAYFAEHVRPGDRLLAVVAVQDPRTEAAIMERFGLPERGR